MVLFQYIGKCSHSLAPAFPTKIQIEGAEKHYEPIPVHQRKNRCSSKRIHPGQPVVNMALSQAAKVAMGYPTEVPRHLRCCKTVNKERRRMRMWISIAVALAKVLLDEIESD